MAAAVGWSLLWAVHLATDAPFECETLVRKLEKELRLEMDMELCTTLVVSRLADKVGEQGHKLET